MRLISKICIAVFLFTAVVACKDTKKVDDTATKAAIEKVEAVEAELETVTKELEQKATELDASLKALDDI